MTTYATAFYAHEREIAYLKSQGFTERLAAEQVRMETTRSVMRANRRSPSSTITQREHHAIETTPPCTRCNGEECISVEDRPRPDRLALAKAIASKTYAFANIPEEGSDQYDCGEWEEMGELAHLTYLDAADAVIVILEDEAVGKGAR